MQTKTPSGTKGSGITAREIKRRYESHLRYSRCKDVRSATDYDKLISLSMAVRDLAVDRMIATQGAYLDRDARRVYYLSMEFLIGRLLSNNILSLGIVEATQQALQEMGLRLEQLIGIEADAGLGNGGLGRLAACYLDSLATLEYPAYGYGIRYEHGMFRQEFDNGWQMERPDDWMKYGNPWEMVRPEYTVPVIVYGRVEEVQERGRKRSVWVDWQMLEGVPYDIPVIGQGVNTVNILRLWSSRATEGFRLDVFNQGDYVKAVEEKNWAENISKVLYPSDSTHAGKELRLIQEYFLVTCAVRDIMRRYLKNHTSFDNFAADTTMQMNDTHPALTVAELMRYFLDEVNMPWEQAWEITSKTLNYTNHTLMPEALEKWPVPLLERVLPRHLQIIYAINERFLQQIRLSSDNHFDRIQRMSLIEEGDVKQVRMANLAIVGSHRVNGVSALHSDLIKKRLVPDFDELCPEKFINVTNGISHRRWLMQCNPGLAQLISGAIGDGWIRDLDELRALEEFAGDAAFRKEFARIKRNNKMCLTALIREQTGQIVDPDSLFDVHVKRLHEYKRQLLNALHIMTLFYRLKANPKLEIVPRTFIFGAKAAPSYHHAKLIIKLINTLGQVINHDADVGGRLKVVFLPDYNVSLAESIIPAADLSEQISTAGWEASGTGNMKLSLNGALTIGTWDGANIEIAEAVGLENIFIFGHRAEELINLRDNDYLPRTWMDHDEELRHVLHSLLQNPFIPSQPELFSELYRALTEGGDCFFHLADYRSYVDKQGEVSALFTQNAEWSRKAILNVARMGPFSSDRSIREYAEKIWNLQPVPIQMNHG
ncbi:MAG: glycogen/starch/alpha-glucan phosphorylase [Verrucomicrobia bacterium]|nr:MAG: glycogen/starch/alpha-glucan phosphorylase [Verrucomicrobiota bacterium]